MSYYIVQTGVLGQIGRFRSVSGMHFPLRQQVICRTDRGLEVGIILNRDDTPPLEDRPQNSADHDTAIVSNGALQGLDGVVLRRVESTDQLLIQRLERYRDKAFQACQELLHQRGIQSTLVDVEHLFDGQSLYFYFLGQIDDEVESLIGELTKTYDKKVRFKKFAETLANGCGPDCGTSVGGCKDSCSDCPAQKLCKTK